MTLLWQADYNFKHS